MSLNSTVVSLVPFPINEEKPGLFPPRFHIDASDMKIPSLLRIGTASHFVYLDESRGSLRVPDPSDQVARSICEDYIESQISIDDNARPALFWVPEEINLESELVAVFEKLGKSYNIEKARYLGKQRKWFDNVAKLADNDWNRYHQHNVVSDFQRKCADFLGWRPEQHEWMSPHTMLEAIRCPFCGVNVPKDLPTCSNGHIVNPKLHKEVQENLARI